MVHNEMQYISSVRLLLFLAVLPTSWSRPVGTCNDVATKLGEVARHHNFENDVVRGGYYQQFELKLLWSDVQGWIWSSAGGWDGIILVRWRKCLASSEGFSQYVAHFKSQRPRWLACTAAI